MQLLFMMADKELAAVSGSEAKQDPGKVADEIVNNLKSQGLFDQFRKECLEELEHLEAYRMLKQRVENHVASFLSKYKWSEKMSKNNLRDNLRMNINRSENLLNGIDRLVDQMLAAKSESFSERISPEINKYLGIDSTEELAPGMHSSLGENVPTTGTNTTMSNSSEMNLSKTVQSTKVLEPSFTLSTSQAPQLNAKTSSQAQAHAVAKVNEKRGNDQIVEKHQNDTPAKCQRSSMVQPKGSMEPNQPESITKVQSVYSQSKRESVFIQGSENNVAKSRGTIENISGSQKLGKEEEGKKLKKDSDKSYVKTEKDMNPAGSVHIQAGQESDANVEIKKSDTTGSKAQAISEIQSNVEVKTKSELQSSSKIEKMTKIFGNECNTDNSCSNRKVEESEKGKDSMSGQKYNLVNDKTNEVGRECLGREFDTKDVKSSSVTGNKDNDEHTDKTVDSLVAKGQPPSGTGVNNVIDEIEVKEDADKELLEDSVVDVANQSVDVKEVVEKRGGKEKAVSTTEHETVKGDSKKVVCKAGEVPNVYKEVTENMNMLKRGEVEIAKEDKKFRTTEAIADENLPKDDTEGRGIVRNPDKHLLSTKNEVNHIQRNNPENSSISGALSSDVTCTANDDCETAEKDYGRVDVDHEKSINSTEISSTLDLQLGVGQRRVKRRKRLISEDEEEQSSKSARADDYEGHQSTEDSKMPLSIEDLKPKKSRGRPRKSGNAKSESQHSSDNELPVTESSVNMPNRTDQGRSKWRSQEEPIESRGLKRQRSVGSESNASDTCVEDRDTETNRRTRRQIKPKRCYSPSDGK